MAEKKKRGCIARTFLLLTAAVVVLVIIVSIASSGESEQAEPITARRGEMVQTKRFEISIQKLEMRDEVGNDFFNSSPAEGGVYVALKYKYKNISDEPIGSFSTPSAELVGPNGTGYSRDSGASSSFAVETEIDQKILSDLNPGIAVTTVDVFEISKEQISSGQWHIEISSTPKVVVPLPVKS